jgi:16S rRNA (uracil1498-N3)-methyltransferase
VFLPSLDSLDVGGAELHHLRRALRLRAGELVCAADGQGSYRMCRMGAGSSEPLEADGEVCRVPAPSPSLRVGFAPLKGDRTEWVVQKLTELGIDVIELLVAERSVVRWDRERAGRQHERLSAVARSAAEQSRRLWLPELRITREGDPLPPGPLADSGGRALRADDTTLLVGPEGGWTDAERASRDLVGLGPQVLRADTASVVAAALMAGLRAGVVAAAEADDAAADPGR